MKAFTVTYTTRSGQSKQLTLEAESINEARRALRRRRIFYTDVSPKEGVAASGSSPAAAGAAKALVATSSRTAASRSSRTPAPSARVPVVAKQNSSFLSSLLESPPSIKDKAVFASKLAVLINAGVPILRSIDLVQSQQKSPLFKRALAAMVFEVNQGENVATSMRRWPKVFDKLMIAMVEAGEAGGVLDETLTRLAKLLEDNAKLQNQIKGALSYPVAVLFLAILVFLGMTIFIIPTFAGIFEQLGADLPPFTQLLVDLSSTLRSPASFVIAGVIIVAVIIFSQYYKTPTGRRQVDQLILKLPLFGDLIQKTATAQFSRTLASLSRAGVPIMMALDILTETASNTIFSDAISKSRVDVSEGIPLSTALSSKNVFPELSINMLMVGEETGNMDAMLSKVADFYEDEVSSTAKMLTSLIEPFMIVFVGGIVASILVAMYLPMFSVFEKIR
ncbi:MAG: type II secretion system F family protein [Cyanobacteria bacterium K_Offshore_surface_m2_239]|nr:type II secretion system F family protein [Cyanobacteria bacterium K_Offshore_surface_m2_239]